MAETKQFGGWYNNPEAGGKNMRWWGDKGWTTGSDPTVPQPSTASQPSSIAQSLNSNQPTATPVDYAQIAQEQQRIQQEAVKPVVASLEAQKAPLQARYDNLIKQLQGKETQEVGAQQTALSQEYGKRGIPLSSGAFSQDLMGKTQAITQNYAGLQGEAVASEQADLANLATTIAQAQASGNTQAAQNAMTLWQQTQAQKEADRTYQNVTLPTTQANLANIQS
jgi:hypothetical protein